MKPGDWVITKSGLWWKGNDISERIGRIRDTTGHILVDLFDFKYNPVKCFRSEVELFYENLPGTDDNEDYLLSDEDIQNLLDNLP